MRHIICEYLNELNKNDLTSSYSIDAMTLQKEIECLTFDTRELSSGAMFICKGKGFKKEYLEYAMDNGCLIYVSEEDYLVDFPHIIVKDIRAAMPILAKMFYDDSPSKLFSIGITGTKGKSTTAYFVRYILDEYLESIGKPKCAILSSIDTYDGIINKESTNTTPEAFDVYKHFANAYNSGISHLVMEVSSQALKYGRTSGINYDITCFTNMGIDHLSPAEHLDFQDYFQSKLKIFASAKKACIYSGADYFDQIYNEAKKNCEVITFGYNESDTVYSKSSHYKDGKTYFYVRTPDFEDEMVISMVGSFNVSNALAAISIAYLMGIPYEAIKNGLYKAKCSGRMMVYESKNKNVTVIVDYAHNGLSFKALYDSVKKDYPDKKIITVFGSAGGKAQNRRKDLGELAGKNSDYVIITEEDPAKENVELVSQDIEQYVKETGCNYAIVNVRKKAIFRAIVTINFDKKIVLITGKGEELFMKRASGNEPYEGDPTCVNEALDIYNIMH